MESGSGDLVEYKLFVAGLSSNVDDDALWSAFKRFGDIPFARVCMDRNTGGSRGFGFVCFGDKAHATTAAREMDGSMLLGKKLAVQVAEEKKVDRFVPGTYASQPAPAAGMPVSDEAKLFVRALSWATTDATLRGAFEKYGTVAYARVQTERDSGRSRGFGFVCFLSRPNAATACKAMDQATLDGRKIHVQMAQAKVESFDATGVAPERAVKDPDRAVKDRAAKAPPAAPQVDENNWEAEDGWEAEDDEAGDAQAVSEPPRPTAAAKPMVPAGPPKEPTNATERRAAARAAKQAGYAAAADAPPAPTQPAAEEPAEAPEAKKKKKKKTDDASPAARPPAADEADATERRAAKRAAKRARADTDDETPAAPADAEAEAEAAAEAKAEKKNAKKKRRAEAGSA
ncbi:hypothetical protein M885DRAFT_626530 [Pelagophyceae sp. CCMP2097]|nr:hypothetical protein M885DRAFT_626530 [Pelagophyceae sp. CCMP2097]